MAYPLALLTITSVEVACPECHENQEADNGGHIFDPEQFFMLPAIFYCGACGVEISRPAPPNHDWYRRGKFHGSL